MVYTAHKQLEDFSNPLALNQPYPHLLVQIGVNQLIPE
ncbi:Os06g0184833 [Oryza sativa Japonica Group]|uniref:Os06g0184833 protein n=1 Tax=Oryza sativa subsp. japonica TaxID=39947 RepID=C7J3D6_ORYSJ|nr:Os06g0184833 [Oryza sativa Japonica Group]|eukprot:NP_001174640.1 Os06g0184833 [Oryza sativa Japonica Group]